jgi:UDP-N-acetyl-2-amino-2-deoxyglucuronate dehydrogenase
VTNVPMVSNPGPHAAVIRDFEAAVREKRPPLSDGYSARDTTELILRIYGRFRP